MDTLRTYLIAISFAIFEVTSLPVVNDEINSLPSTSNTFATQDYDEMPLPLEMFGDNSLFSQAILGGLDNKVWFFPNHPRNTLNDSPKYQQESSIVPDEPLDNSNDSITNSNIEFSQSKEAPSPPPTIYPVICTTSTEQLDNLPNATQNINSSSPDVEDFSTEQSNEYATVNSPEICTTSTDQQGNSTNDTPNTTQTINSSSPNVEDASPELSIEYATVKSPEIYTTSTDQLGNSTNDTPNTTQNLNLSSPNVEDVSSELSNENPASSTTDQENTQPANNDRVNNYVGIGGVINNIVNNIINRTNITMNVVKNNYYGNEVPKDDLAQLDDYLNGHNFISNDS